MVNSGATLASMFPVFSQEQALLIHVGTKMEEADFRMPQIANIGSTLMIGQALLIAALMAGRAHAVN